MHFTDKLPLKLDTDASQYGVGAVILHVNLLEKNTLLPMHAHVDEEQMQLRTNWKESV